MSPGGGSGEAPPEVAPAAPGGETPSSTSAREASRGSAVRLSAEIVVRLSSVLATLWLTRTLGVAGFGQFVVALSIGLVIAELCDLGLNAIVVPLIVRSNRNLTTLFRLKLIMTLVTAMLCLVLIPLSSWISGVEAPLVGLCTIYFLGSSWIDLMGTTLRTLGRGMDEAGLLFASRLVLLGLVISAPFGPTVKGAAVAYALSVAPALALALWRLFRARSSGGPAGSSVRAILRQAAPMGANGYLAILSTRIEIFLLQVTVGEHAVGLFGGALRIVESLLTLPGAIAAGALPAVARDVLHGSRGAAQRTFGMVVWMGVPCAVGLALCAPGIMGVLGPGFLEGASVLRILSVALLLCFANAALYPILIAAGETAVIPQFTAARVGVAAVLGGVLIPWLGLLGGVLSYTIAELSLFGLLLRRTRVHADLHVGQPLGWALLACLPMTALLSVWSLSLPAAIAGGALLFAVSAGLILRRGTRAIGLA